LFLHILKKSTSWPTTPRATVNCQWVLLATSGRPCGFWSTTQWWAMHPYSSITGLASSIMQVFWISMPGMSHTVTRCISFLTIINMVLGSTVLSSRSSQETQSKLETWLCHNLHIYACQTTPSLGSWATQYTCWTLVLKFTWLPIG
jgi:hypothetical protein